MSTTDSPKQSLTDILGRFFPTTPLTAPESEIPQSSHTIYPDTTYTENEKVEISQWLTTSSRLATPEEDEAKHAERLGSLNIHLSTRTTLLGSKPSVADVALYARLASTVRSWSADERTGEHGYHHIVRYMDFVQNSPVLGLSLSEDDKVKIDVEDVRFVHKPLDAKEEKERKKKEKAAAAATNGEAPKSLVVGQGRNQEVDKSKKTQNQDPADDPKENIKGAVVEGFAQPKKEKKEKQPKPQKQPAKELSLSPCLIDLRVGHILKAVNHPNADSLYVSTIACGDPAGTENTSEYEGQVVRTVCSGLSGLIPLEEMQGRKIVAVCNLKPVTMRGIKSAAMVLAASPRVAESEDSHKGPVELVNPPAEAKAGERIYFDGWQGEPEAVLNPKKKIWETIQPGFTTTEDLGVAFDVNCVPQLQGEATNAKPALGALLAASGGKCTVKSLRGATVR
ncbi:G4 quadruplex nucleic acid binding protein [Lignoscripta atroalba]|nr:G4 quadruplex nucleic acid binding protein [Lignoscripta atroalba]